MDHKKLEAEYNRILARIKKGEAYLDGNSLPDVKKVAAVVRYNELLNKIAVVVGKLQKILGRDLTHEELLGGF